MLNHTFEKETLVMSKRDMKNQATAIENETKERHFSTRLNETETDTILDFDNCRHTSFMTSSMYGDRKRPKPAKNKTPVENPCDYPRSRICPDSPPPMKTDYVVNPKYKEKKRRKDGEDD